MGGKQSFKILKLTHAFKLVETSQEKDLSLDRTESTSTVITSQQTEVIKKGMENNIGSEQIKLNECKVYPQFK